MIANIMNKKKIIKAKIALKSSEARDASLPAGMGKWKPK